MAYKTYTELCKLKTFEERYNYLRCTSKIGDSTFGNNRYLNQNIYKSTIWKSIRNKVIIRDNGCDMGLENYPIFKNVYIHHINPINVNDILNNDPKVYDMENLISVSFETHNAIHYGDNTIIKDKNYIERKEGDTCPWK